MISIDVLKFTNHEDYNTTTYENDISILELAEERNAALSLVGNCRDTGLSLVDQCIRTLRWVP